MNYIPPILRRELTKRKYSNLLIASEQQLESRIYPLPYSLVHARKCTLIKLHR